MIHKKILSLALSLCLSWLFHSLVHIIPLSLTHTRSPPSYSPLSSLSYRLAFLFSPLPQLSRSSLSLSLSLLSHPHTLTTLTHVVLTLSLTNYPLSHALLSVAPPRFPLFSLSHIHTHTFFLSSLTHKFFV